MMFDKKGRLVVSFQATAADIDLVDAGGLITATEVESALQEIFGDYQAGGVARTLGGDLDLNGNSINNLLGIGATPISAAQWGYVGALTTHPIGGDGTAGRIPRGFLLIIDNGGNASTLKCKTLDRWNGDIIGEQDNIAKNATTGVFSLNADGTVLKILSTGLTGNCVFAIGEIQENATNTDFQVVSVTAEGDDIRVHVMAKAASYFDLTSLVDQGRIMILVFYITSA